MDAVDKSVHSSSTSDRSETHQGRMETEQGFARMRGEIPGIADHSNVSNVGTGGGTSSLLPKSAPRELESQKDEFVHMSLQAVLISITPNLAYREVCL